MLLNGSFRISFYAYSNKICKVNIRGVEYLKALSFEKKKNYKT